MAKNFDKIGRQICDIQPKPPNRLSLPKRIALTFSRAVKTKTTEVSTTLRGELKPPARDDRQSPVLDCPNRLKNIIENPTERSTPNADFTETDVHLIVVVSPYHCDKVCHENPSPDLERFLSLYEKDATLLVSAREFIESIHPSQKAQIGKGISFRTFNVFIEEHYKTKMFNAVGSAMIESGLIFKAKSARFIGAPNHKVSVPYINIEAIRLYADAMTFIDIEVNGGITLPYLKPAQLHSNNVLLSQINLPHVRYGLRSLVVINCTIYGEIGCKNLRYGKSMDYIIPIKPHYYKAITDGADFESNVIYGPQWRSNIWRATLKDKTLEDKAKLSNDDMFKILSDFSPETVMNIDLDYIENHNGVILFNSYSSSDDHALQPTYKKKETFLMKQSALKNNRTPNSR